MRRFQRQVTAVSRTAGFYLLAAAALAFVTWVGLRVRMDAAAAAVLYLAIVIGVSLGGRLLPAVATAAGAVGLLDYFFTPPLHAIAIRQPLDLVAFVVFAATAVVITRLISRLRHSEDRWRDVFDNNPTMYFVVDPSGVVLSVNPFGASQLGYEVGELVGESVLQVFPPEERDVARGHLESCLRNFGKSMNWEIRKVHRDGRVLWVRETARAVERPGEPPIVLIACEDVTEATQARDRVRQSEAQLLEQASLLDLTHDAMFVRDGREIIRYWNRGAEELYGWSSEEAVGQVCHELLKTKFPAPVEEILDEVQRAGHWTGELVHVTRDGRRVVLVSRWATRRDEQGRMIGTLETNTDVTARRRAEDSLRQSRADLARAATLSTMGEFAASIAHELRQPLAAIVMNGSAARRWVDRNPPDIDETRAAIGRVVSEAQRADEVIKSLRSLVSRDGQQHALVLNDLVDHVLALVRSEAQRHQVSVQTHLDRELPAATGDPVQLQQVILNLVVNGIEAAATGAGPSRSLVVRTECVDPHRVALTVEDSGPGIETDNLTRIFEPFYTTKPNGLGLGLSICRSIIDQHGGELHVSSLAPTGTAFRFTIPATVGRGGVSLPLASEREGLTVA
jgi:PAS domain S-box-containing protein